MNIREGSYHYYVPSTATPTNDSHPEYDHAGSASMDLLRDAS